MHVITVNDYLAQRDADWMGRLYSWLGLTTGVNLSQMDHDVKQAAYAADITYGTNNEFGFDYLRDNMVYEARERVQRSLSFAVVDEVDSILIDEARTPLIISGQAENHTDLYYKINEVPKMLTLQVGEETPDGKGVVSVPGDYTKDEKAHSVLLTSKPRERGSDPDQDGSAAGRRLAVRLGQHHPDPPPVRGPARMRCTTRTSTTWCKTMKW